MFNSVSDARQIISSLEDTLHRDDAFSDPEVYGMIEAIQQVIDTLGAVNKRDKLLTIAEVTDVGEQGLLLIDNLIYKLTTQGYEIHRHEIGHVALVIANWVINHGGELESIQSVVDALANMANDVTDTISLLQLSTFMNQVAHACTSAIQSDTDNSDTSRPWLALSMNRGIVATRTHDIELMNTVFTDLTKAIPLEAPQFFKEGMIEMERLNYPQSVCDLMSEFYEQTKPPVVH